MDRISEVLFGLLEVRTMLIGALGCNLAWGIIDAGLYLIARLSERARYRMLLGNVKATNGRAGKRSSPMRCPMHSHL